ncbi:MAG: DUF2911 domain-containing protein [Bacteroidota bacterium]
MKQKFTLIIGALLLSAVAAHAQIKTPSPSPVQTIKQDIGLSEFEVSYSRPSSKGRTIYGDLVPYGKMWRTGANASTKLKFNDAMTFNGVKVEKGEYALYTIPNATEWTVILYKDVTCWGVCEEYSADKEAAKFMVKPSTLANAVETFTISIDDVTSNGATLRLSWAKTAVDIKIANDVDSKVVASIDAFMNPKPDFRPYFNAASYYYEANKELNKALEYVNKAAAIQPAFWVLHLKAKIQYAMKDYKGAMATAELSKKAAAEAKNDDYVALNDKLIEKAKSGK